MVIDRFIWLLPIFIWSCLSKTSAARHGRKDLLSAAMVVGAVYCDTCSHQSVSKKRHFIAGAYVRVECGEARAGVPTFRKEVKTDENGEFNALLPFRLEKHMTRIKRCRVKLLNSSQPHCSAASIATSSLHLKSRKQRTHIFSAGFFSFKPLKLPKLCFKKPISKTRSFADQKTTRALVSNGEKAKIEEVEDTFWPPLLPFIPPPPSILPPNPLIPPPPPFFNFPPIPFFPSPPPPPPFFNFPPIPFFTPPPPPPPPPAPFFNFPPIPFFTPPPLVPYVPLPPFPFPPRPPPAGRQHGQFPWKNSP